MGVPRLSPFTVIKVYNYNNFLYPSENAVCLLGPGDMIVTIAGCSVAYLPVFRKTFVVVIFAADLRVRF